MPKLELILDASGAAAGAAAFDAATAKVDAAAARADQAVKKVDQAMAGVQASAGKAAGAMDQTVGAARRTEDGLGGLAGGAREANSEFQLLSGNGKSAAEAYQLVGRSAGAASLQIGNAAKLAALPLIGSQGFVFARVAVQEVQTLRAAAAEARALGAGFDVITGAATNSLSVVGSFGAVLRANPVGALITGLGLAVGAYFLFRDETDKTTEALSKQKAAADAAADALQRTYEQLDSARAGRDRSDSLGDRAGRESSLEAEIALLREKSIELRRTGSTIGNAELARYAPGSDPFAVDGRVSRYRAVPNAEAVAALEARITFLSDGVSQSKLKTDQSAASKEAAKAIDTEREALERLIEQQQFEISIAGQSVADKAVSRALYEAEAKSVHLDFLERAQLLGALASETAKRVENEEATKRTKGALDDEVAAFVRTADARNKALDQFDEYQTSIEREISLASLTNDQRDDAVRVLEFEAAARAAGKDDVAGLTEAYRQQLITLRGLTAEQERAAAVQEFLNEHIKQLNQEQGAARRFASDSIADLRFETSLIGQTTAQREISSRVRQAEIQLISLEADERRDLVDAIRDEATVQAGVGLRLANDERIRSLKEERSLIGLTNQERVIQAALLDFDRQNAGFKDLVADQRVLLEDTLRENEALELMAERARGVGEALGSGLEEAAIKFEDFGAIGRGVLEDLQRLAVRSYIVNPFQEAVTSGLFGLFGGGGSTVASANGNVFTRGNVTPFADGGVFTRPTYLPLANGSTGLFGEAGDEAALPLTRTRSGKLGVRYEGGGGARTIVRETNVYMTVYANDADSFGRSQRQIEDDLQRRIR